jgi:hypothetical protein
MRAFPRAWWRQQSFPQDQKIDYFRRWPPPHRWLAFLIEAVWGIATFEEQEKSSTYFDRTAELGFGSRQDYERDLNDPKWLEREREPTSSGG